MATMLGWPARYVETAMSLCQRLKARAPLLVLISVAASTALPACRFCVRVSTLRRTGPHWPRDPAVFGARTSCGPGGWARGEVHPIESETFSGPGEEALEVEGG